MNWVLNNIPLLVFAFVLFSVVRAIVRASRLSEQHRADPNETEEQKHLREIQDRIRRKIAERRGGAMPPAPAEAAPAERAPGPPVLSAPRVPPLDPFGGPMKRLVTQLERRVRQSPPAPSAAQMAANLERQEQLAEQMRALEGARALAQRRAVEIAAIQKGEAESETGVRTVARGQLLTDLGGAPSLRRAFVLREVLGTPVGLR